MNDTVHDTKPQVRRPQDHRAKDNRRQVPQRGVLGAEDPRGGRAGGAVVPGLQAGLSWCRAWQLGQRQPRRLNVVGRRCGAAPGNRSWPVGEWRAGYSRSLFWLMGRREPPGQFRVAGPHVRTGTPGMAQHRRGPSEPAPLGSADAVRSAAGPVQSQRSAPARCRQSRRAAAGGGRKTG